MDPNDKFIKNFGSIQELPQEFAYAIAQRVAGEDVQKVVWIPPYEYPIVKMFWRFTLPYQWKATPPRALVYTEKTIFFAEKDESNEVHVYVIPFKNIFHTEVAINLLYAYIFLSWAEGSELISRRIEFNAVGEYSMRRQMDSLRTELSTRIVNNVGEDGYRNIFVADPGSKPVPLKFQNYLIYSLVSNEKVISAVFQPAIRKGKNWLTGLQHPRRLIALTDRHIIVIEEDRSIGANYSVITRFYPLAKIDRLDFVTAQDDLIHININEINNGSKEEITIPLQASGALWFRKAFVKTGIKLQDLVP